MGTGKEELMERQEDAQHGRYLTFALGKEVFGIEIRYVTEIIGIQPITMLPEVPEFIKGIINLRGRIIPVIDMRLKFRKEAVEYDDRTCIIIIESQELSIGLIVDNVADVLTIGDEDNVPLPKQQIGISSKYIKSIGKVGDSVKLLLDCENLFNEDETQILCSVK